MADEKKSIFDLADKFDVVNPFGNWVKEDFKQTDIFKTRIASILVERNNKKPVILVGNSNKTSIYITVTVKIEGEEAVVDISCDNGAVPDGGIQTKNHSRDNVTGLYSYEATRVFFFSVDKNSSQLKTYKLSVQVTSGGKILDKKEDKFTVDTRGVVMSTTSNNNLIPINYSIHTIEFHVYANNEIEKWIPKDYDKKSQKGKIKYVYHDINGDLYDIAELEFHYAQKRKNGQKVNSIPDNYIETYNYPKGGDAKTAYLYENGDIYVDGITKRYGFRKYPKDEGFAQLVRMPDSLNIKKDNFSINYKFENPQRRYCNPESFAGFVGALAEISKPVICTGMCFEDSTSYPSLSHPNGDSADTAYYSTLEEEQKKVNAFLDFHFLKIYRGNISWYPQLKGTRYSDGHNDHLHAGDFDSNVVKLKIIE